MDGLDLLETQWEQLSLNEDGRGTIVVPEEISGTEQIKKSDVAW